MSTPHNLYDSLQNFTYADGKTGTFYSLPALQAALSVNLSKLPVSIRIVLESVLRNCDGKRVEQHHIQQLASWQPNAQRIHEIPFVVARIVLQDFTGVPLLVDLAAMRSAVSRQGSNPALIEPLVPVDLVIDHSVQVDYFGTADALQKNRNIEFSRNNARYQFLKWGTQAFSSSCVSAPALH